MTPTPRPIEVVIEQESARLLSISGVVGVGLGACQGNPCIKVFVRQKTAAVLARLPKNIDGYEVSVEETDEFTPRGSP